MSHPTVLVLTRDLFFAEPIARAVANAGGRARVVENARELAEALAERPVLVVVEMGRMGEGDWLEATEGVRALAPEMPVLAFGSHVDVAARDAARRAGCDFVWARSRFVREFPGFVERYVQQATDFACCEEALPELVREGLMLFNQGAFYRCHDALEEAWRAESRACRRLYQGILQLGIAIYQAQRGNVRGAEKMFARAKRKFEGLPDRCQGVDVAGLRAMLAQLYREFRDAVPDRLDVFPNSPPQIIVD